MDKTEQRKGLTHALLAHLLWGVLPLYFKLVIMVSPWEVLGNRILWTLGLVLLILAVRGEMRLLLLVLRTPRLLGALTASGLFIATSWLLYIWAVANDHVVAVSLGYFLSPLINVLLGIVVLRERLSRNQWLAIGIAAAGVAILAAEAPETFGISLTIAIAFALYGLVRKTTPVSPLVGLGVETLVLVAPAIGMLLWAQQHGGLAFGAADDITLLLIASGVITSAPLLLFASAARRLTLVTNGLLQFVSPTMQFLLGVLAFGEPMTAERWVSFVLIWAGLAVFIWPTLSRRLASPTA